MTTGSIPAAFGNGPFDGHAQNATAFTAFLNDASNKTLGGRRACSFTTAALAGAQAFAAGNTFVRPYYHHNGQHAAFALPGWWYLALYMTEQKSPSPFRAGGRCIEADHRTLQARRRRLLHRRVERRPPPHLQDHKSGARAITVRDTDALPVYVENGAADIGVSGKDQLEEQDKPIYEMLDLGFGYCRLVVAEPKSLKENDGQPLDHHPLWRRNS